MRILVLGCGLMGSVIVSDLVKSKDVSEVVIADIDEKKLHECVVRLQSSRLSTRQVDVHDRKSLINLLRDFDVVASALPHRLAVSTDKACIETGVSIVDLTFEQRQMLLAKAAEKAGVTLIPGCGVAPGLGNILAGHGAEQLERVDEIHIMCGGIPQIPNPPLFYKVVFAPETLWELYTRSPRIVRNGKVKVVPPLSDLERVRFPEPFGELESFYTDGLATLLYTMKEVKNMDEKTLRWPGHIEKIKTLIDCNLLDTKLIKIDGYETTPQRLLTRLLSPILEQEEVKDVTLMRVIVSGKKNMSNAQYTYEMIDYYDYERGITSMARTTGYPCSIACQMIARGEINMKGLVPPEKAFQGELFKKFTIELAKRNIHFRETFTTARYMDS